MDTSKDEFLLFSRKPSIRPIATASLPVRAVRKLGRMIRSPKKRPVRQFRTCMQVCATCHGVTPCHEYSFEDLLGLYRDYRSETYNHDRISVEPGYAQIAKDVGSHPLEIKNRNSAVDGFLNRNARAFNGGVMLDYGGSDGRLIPSFVHETFEEIHIYDPSKVSLHPSVDARKIKTVATPQPGIYSFLTCMHVLEHVGSPRAVANDAARLMAPGGLMYVEVPLELTEDVRDNLTQRIIDTPIIIHEHMNAFDRVSIRELLKSIRMEMVDDAADVIDLGWIRGLVGRFLARKAKS
jgi:hypothetical protein